jgi:hypothetical protein
MIKNIEKLENEKNNTYNFWDVEKLCTIPITAGFEKNKNQM